MSQLTNTKTTIADVSALMRARTPLLWVVTKEEKRVERYIQEAAIAASYIPTQWDCAQGFTNMQGKLAEGEFAGQTDPAGALNIINVWAQGVFPDGRQRQTAERRVWIMRDLHSWLIGPIGFQSVRMLRNLAKSLPDAPRERAQCIVVLTTEAQIPNELIGHCTVLDWPLPDKGDIAAILDAALAILPAGMKDKACNEAQRLAAIDAAIGLSGEEARLCFDKSLVLTKTIDPAKIAQEKKRTISKERILEWHDPIDGGLDAIGGLDVLKDWATRRASAFSPRAQAYGLVRPKGCLVVGIPGTGKSLFAKCLATSWACPLIKFDMGALKSKFVGESEGNFRKALKTLKALGRCIVWIDEIEKSLQGATSGSSDGGVSADALGQLLTWMQEKEDESFIVATANDVSGLPPELLRKGRFDEVFFVDLPTAAERGAVFNAALRSHKRQALQPDALASLAEATQGFTGAEIAALVPDAMFASFEDGERELSVNDLLKSAGGVIPLSKTASEKIKRLQAWAKGRARYASTRDAEHIEADVANNGDVITFEELMAS